MRAWEEFLKQEENELGKATIDKWLRPLNMVRFDACNLYLEAKDAFQAIWFEEHARHRVRTRLYNNNHKLIKVHISVVAQTEESELAQRQKKNLPPSPGLPPFRLQFDELNPEATFTSFVTSKNNLLPFKILCESCHVDLEKGDAPEAKISPLTFNPIYLFGRSGSGKTHLMMSAANAFNKRGLRTIYVRADTFTEHVVNAIRAGEMQAFRKTYRNAQALLIDDVEIFSRKGATQEEFFHTFNTLHTEGKQIILSSTLSPQELTYIEPRLVSRFEWGIVVPLQPLEKEDLSTVLQVRAEKMDFPLDEKTTHFLLETFGGNTKTLIQALEALVLRTHLNQGLGNVSPLPISLHIAQQYLSDMIQQEEKALLTPGKIIRTVAEFYGIRMDDILSKSQARECALPRQIAMHLCREKLNLPFMKIGDIFSRDHSTVMASVKQVQKSLESKNHEVCGSIRNVLKKLNQS